MSVSEDRVRYEAAEAGDRVPPATPDVPAPRSAPEPPAGGAGQAASQAAAQPQPPYVQPSSSGPAAQTERAFDPRRKSPALACILSVMPGLGQIYVGYYKLGFTHAIVFGTTIVVLANEFITELTPLFGIFLGFFYLYNIVDAGRRAAFYNQALAGMQGVQVPTDMTLPSRGGSLAGGVALIVIGFVLLSNTMFGIPWYWLEEWWPVAPIALGVYLFMRGLKEKADKKEG